MHSRRLLATLPLLVPFVVCAAAQESDPPLTAQEAMKQCIAREDRLEGGHLLFRFSGEGSPLAPDAPPVAVEWDNDGRWRIQNEDGSLVLAVCNGKVIKLEDGSLWDMECFDYLMGPDGLEDAPSWLEEDSVGLMVQAYNLYLPIFLSHVFPLTHMGRIQTGGSRLCDTMSWRGVDKGEGNWPFELSPADMVIIEVGFYGVEGTPRFVKIIDTAHAMPIALGLLVPEKVDPMLAGIVEPGYSWQTDYREPVEVDGEVLPREVVSLTDTGETCYKTELILEGSYLGPVDSNHFRFEIPFGKKIIRSPDHTSMLSDTLGKLDHWSYRLLMDGDEPSPVGYALGAGLVLSGIAYLVHKRRKRNRQTHEEA